MFLDRVQGLGLLSHDPESDILESFPLPVRKILIQEVVTFLGSSEDPSNLSSQAHVRWVMEVVGAAFALPIEEGELIK